MKETVIRLAEEMCLAAHTAPKAKGYDFIEAKVVTESELKKLSQKMLEIGEREQHPTFLRDGQNILSAAAVVLIGTKIKTIGLKYCGYCGFEDCVACEQAGAVCAYNSGDLGIAVGSAVSVAMDHRLDNRIMYTAGKGAIAAGLFGPEIKIAYGIPLSATGKNPFFDRK